MKKESPIKNLVKALKKDKEYREAWKANIAMSFKDNYSWHKDTTGKRSMSKDDIHVIANRSAEYFLQLLCNEIKYPKGR